MVPVLLKPTQKILLKSLFAMTVGLTVFVKSFAFISDIQLTVQVVGTALQNICLFIYGQILRAALTAQNILQTTCHYKNS